MAGADGVACGTGLRIGCRGCCATELSDMVAAAISAITFFIVPPQMEPSAECRTGTEQGSGARARGELRLLRAGFDDARVVNQTCIKYFAASLLGARAIAERANPHTV